MCKDHNEANQAEVEFFKLRSASTKRNEMVFFRLMPSLIKKNNHKFALMRHGSVVDYFNDWLGAATRGDSLYKDGIHSVHFVSQGNYMNMLLRGFVYLLL